MYCPPVSPGGGSEVPAALLEPGVGAGLTGSPWWRKCWSSAMFKACVFPLDSGFRSVPQKAQKRPEPNKKIPRTRSQDGGGVGRGEHFLPHEFIKRAFKHRVNSTKQLLNAGRGHQAPRKAIQLFKRSATEQREEIQLHPSEHRHKRP